MTQLHADIVGSVQHRPGEGVSVDIPKGPCEIELTELDATVSWIDGDTRGLTAVPLTDFERWVTEGTVVVR